jgi:hypothetical protein
MSALRFVDYGFGGGYNPSTQSSLIADNQCSYGKNWAYNLSSDLKSASIVKRPGATLVSETIGQTIDSNALVATDSFIVRGIYLRYDGTEQIVSLLANATRGQIYANNGTATYGVTMGAIPYTDLKGTDGDSENYQNKLYIIKNGGKYLEIDGAGSPLTLHVYALTDVDSTAFVGTMIREYQDRMYIAGDTTYPNRLYASAVGDPTDFNTASDAGYIDFPSSITGLGKSEGYLIVHTLNDGCHKIAFDSSNLPYRLEIPKAPGTISHKSIAELDNVQFYLANDGVYQLGYSANYPDSVRSSRVSEDVGVVVDSITDKSRCSGIFMDDKYYLSYRTDSDTTNPYNDSLLVYDFVAKSWYAPWYCDGVSVSGKHGAVPFDHLMSFDNKLLSAIKQVYDNTTSFDSKMYQFTENQLYDKGLISGSITAEYAVDRRYHTKNYSLKDFEISKKLYWTYARYTRIKGGNPSVTVRADDRSNADYTRDLNETLSAGLGSSFQEIQMGVHILGYGCLGGASPSESYSSNYMDIKIGTPLNGSFFKIEFTDNTIYKDSELLGFSFGFRSGRPKFRSNYKIK